MITAFPPFPYYQESDFVAGSDQELNDSDYVAEPKEKKARKSAVAATPKVRNPPPLPLLPPFNDQQFWQML